MPVLDGWWMTSDKQFKHRRKADADESVCGKGGPWQSAGDFVPSCKLCEWATVPKPTPK